MAAAVALFLFGGITAALALELPLGTLRGPGTGFFPLALGLALMGLAAGQGIRTYLTHRRAAPAAVSAATRKPNGDGTTARVLRFMAIVVIATALLEWLGYTLTSFLLMFALLQSLGVRKLQISLPISAATAVGAYVLFVQWLKIPLPGGWPGF